jgi:predicted component of type VI protein secretion system
MPKLTLMLERKTVQTYDLDQPLIRVGRSPEMDIVIDNVSVSRWQAELQHESDHWVVRDIGSSNGTFVNGQRLTSDQPLRPGDAISFGKYSLFFEHVPAGAAAAAPARAATPAAQGDSTMYLKPEEVEQLQKGAAQKRQAHVRWEVGGQSGVHYLGDAPTLLVGTSDRCDLRLPGGPKHHVLMARDSRGVEVRNLSFWRRMRVKGESTKRARLANGDVVEIGGLKLTFMDEVR